MAENNATLVFAEKIIADSLLPLVLSERFARPMLLEWYNTPAPVPHFTDDFAATTNSDPSDLNDDELHSLL
jgi:hypothetical protein